VCAAVSNGCLEVSILRGAAVKQWLPAIGPGASLMLLRVGSEASLDGRRFSSLRVPGPSARLGPAARLFARICARSRRRGDAHGRLLSWHPAARSGLATARKYHPWTPSLRGQAGAQIVSQPPTHERGSLPVIRVNIRFIIECSTSLASATSLAGGFHRRRLTAGRTKESTQLGQCS
jgi:hypothetical protein